MLLWYVFFGTVILNEGHDWNTPSFQIGLPLMASFLLTSWMNLALMWVQLAENSKTLKSSGKNISSKFRVWVIGISVFGTLCMLVFISILGMNVVGGGLAALFLVFIAILYLVGAAKLKGAMSGGGSAATKKIDKIILTARKVSALIFFAIIGDVLYIGLIPILQPFPSSGIMFLQAAFLWVWQFGLLAAGGVIVFFIQEVTQKARGVVSRVSTHAVSPSGKATGTANTTKQQTNVDTATSVTVTEVNVVDRE
jgi:hypothetical protein